MRVDFDSIYTFHIQGNDNERKLICITSAKELIGVKLDENTSESVSNTVKHNFFTKGLYDQSEQYNGEDSLYEALGREGIKRYKKYNYNILKNIVADIMSNAGGYEFLQGLMRYLENDMVTIYISRAIGEVMASK